LILDSSITVHTNYLQLPSGLVIPTLPHCLESCARPSTNRMCFGGWPIKQSVVFCMLLVFGRQQSAAQVVTYFLTLVPHNLHLITQRITYSNFATIFSPTQSNHYNTSFIPDVSLVKVDVVDYLNQDQYFSVFTTSLKKRMKNEKNILGRDQGKNENNHEGDSHVGIHASDKDHGDVLLVGEASLKAALNALGTVHVVERRGMMKGRTAGNQQLCVLFLYIYGTQYLDNLC